MTLQERAAIICSLLNFTPISKQDADNFDAVVKEIEEGEREARINALSDEDPFIEEELKHEYAEGFRAARKKAKEIIADHKWSHQNDARHRDELAKRIGAMKPQDDGEINP